MIIRLTLTAVTLAVSLASVAQAESWVDATARGFMNDILVTDGGSGNHTTAYAGGAYQSMTLNTMGQNGTVFAKSEGRFNDLAVGLQGYGTSAAALQLGIGHEGVINANNGGTAILQQYGFHKKAKISVNGPSTVRVVQY